jgi:hypothetical protein
MVMQTIEIIITKGKVRVSNHMVFDLNNEWEDFQKKLIHYLICA